MTEVRIVALGRMTVEADGRMIQLTPTNVRMLARLLIAEGKAVTQDQLYRDVWEARAGATVMRPHRTLVQRQISELRQKLGTADDGGAVIATERSATSAYRLVLPHDQVDSWHFQRLIEEAREVQAGIAVEMLLEALGLWRDRPFVDVENIAFALQAQRRLVQLRIAARRRLLGALRDLDRIDAAWTLGQELLAEDPDDEDTRAVVDRLPDRASAAQQVLARHAFDRPRITVVLVAGDLLAMRGPDLVVGFSDTFDTSTRDDLIISSRSTQGQLLQRLYGGEQDRLDRDLRRALARVPKVAQEARADKRHGKLARYPMGTVAVLQNGPRRIFCVAYSRMGNDLVARSSVEEISRSLDQLWDSLHRHGQFGDVVMPLVGSGLSRIGAANHQELADLIVRSFVAASRKIPVCRELRIVLAQSQVDKVDPQRLQELLSTL